MADKRTGHPPRSERQQDGGTKEAEAEVEDHLDSYFVDRLRFLNEKDRRSQQLMHKFKESDGNDAEMRNHDSLAVVCVDGSPEADAALAYALHHLPRARSLVLAHGIHVPLTAGTRSAGGALFGEDDGEEERHRVVEERYMRMCHDANRHCMVKHFTFSTKGGFGHAICSLADKKDAASVLIGQRHPRPLLGASSTAVMRYCGRRPVILVPAAAEQDGRD